MFYDILIIMEEVSSQLPQKPKLNLLIPLMAVITVLSFSFSLYLYYQNTKLRFANTLQSDINKASPTDTQIISPTAKEEKIKPTLTQNEYKTVKYGGLFSYEYPVGWHVAELGPNTLVMNPEPISFSPGDGPSGAFELRIINGRQNPNEFLNQEMAKFTQEDYTDIVKETINSDLGQVYYYRGKIKGDMFIGEPVENYYLTFETNQDDPLNQQIIIASMLFKKDPQLSEMLRHVVLSIKNLY